MRMKRVRKLAKNSPVFLRNSLRRYFSKEVIMGVVFILLHYSAFTCKLQPGRGPLRALFPVYTFFPKKSIE